MNFEKYIGIPYVEKGRDTTGLDCYGLVRLIYKNEYKIDLPSFTAEYTVNDTDRIQDLVAQYKEGWEQIDSPSEGSIVLFRILGTESHIGVAISATHFIHVRENQDSAIEAFDSPKWSKRIVGYYKYSEKKGVLLNAVPHPLRTERYTIPVPIGTTLDLLATGLAKEYNIAPELKSSITILVNGRVIESDAWKDTVLTEGDSVEYRAVPKGSGGRMLLMLAVTIVAMQVGMFAATEFAAYSGKGAMSFAQAAAYATAAAVTMQVGMSLVNAIAPIRMPSSGDAGTAAQQYLMSGASNRANPYGAIPIVLGKVRYTPALGSVNYLTYENERDSYLSMLLVWGYGPLIIDEATLRIGQVPLTSYTKYEKITLNRVSEPTDQEKLSFDSIYGKDVTQIDKNLELVCDGNPETTVTPGPWAEAATAVQYGVDVSGNSVPIPVTSVTVALHFPQGLRKIRVKGNGAGDSTAVNLTFRLEYSLDVGVTWLALDVLQTNFEIPKKDGFTFTKTYSNLNHNQMIIRIRRETGDNTEDNPDDRYYFTSILQNVTFLRNAKPAIDPLNSKIAKTAFKILATDQLNGNIEGISAIVQTYCKVWNGSVWVDGQSSNPAALMRYVLEHPANPRRITNASAQINLTALQYFYTYCQTNGFEYNNVLAEARSILEVIRDICAAGRASPALIDGKWTVIIDEVKPNVIQHFTPHNSWGFEGTKALPKRPDGLRVTYYDQDQDYQQAEVIVYDIGKDTTNASLFESISLPGVTKKSLVIDHARWHMAQMKLRPEIYTLNSDIEYLVCNRGDRVKVMHDVPMWGLGSGRIKNRLSATKFQLDEDVPMQAGVSYTMRFRSKNGSSVVRNLVAKGIDGNYTEIDLTSSVTADEVDAGDLFLFGQLNSEAQDLLVLGIEPSSNNSARLTLVDYGVTNSYNIFTDYKNLSASTVFESKISLPPILQQDGFGSKVPSITGFVSDESVMERVSKGVYRYNMNVSYTNASALPISTDAVEVQYDLSSASTSVGYKSVIVPFQNGSASITDVKEGETYKVRMRYITTNGKIGNWTSYSNHTVVGKTNPPAQVTEFIVTADKSSGQLLLSWHNNLEPDISGYEIRTEDAGWRVNDARRIFYGDATKAYTKYATNGSATFYIRAIDSADNYSTVSSVVSFTPTTVPNITDIGYSYSDTALTSASIILNWADVNNSQFDIDHYEVSYDTTVITVKANTITVPADWIGEKIFTVKAVDTHGNKSSGYSESIAKLAPNPPYDLKTQVVDNTVMLYWTLPDRTSLPIDHVIIKKGSTWVSSTLVGEKKGGFTTINESQGGNFTYWMVSVDTEGIQSTPVSVTTLVSEPPDFVFHGEFDSSFTGTKSSAATDGIILALPINTTETFQQHFTSHSWNTPQDQVNAGYPIFIQPSGGSGYYEEVFDFGQPLASSRVSLNYKGVVVAGSPTVVTKISLSLDNTTYVDYNGVTDVFGLNFRYVKIRIAVTGASSVDLYEISNLTVRLDAKLKNDAGTNYIQETDALGTIVNFNKEFIDVQSITLSPSGLEPVMAVYDFKDTFYNGTYSITSNVCTVTMASHGLITGQKVKLFFSNGNGVTGIYLITAYTTNTFTVSMVASNATGNCSMYPQSFRAYLFKNSGNRQSANMSWSIKGY